MVSAGEKWSPWKSIALGIETMDALTSIAEEQRKNIRQFDAESRDKLLGNGYSIYTLTGLSTEEMRNNFRDIGGWLKDRPHLLDERSRRSEVAISPNSFYLPNSGDKSLAEQLSMVEQFGHGLQNKIPGTVVAIGTAADNIELSTRHANKTGKPFKDEIGTFTRTLSSGAIGPDSVVAVGRGGRKAEIFLMPSPSKEGVSNLKIAPLIFPALGNLAVNFA